jgi:hypothetical protein
MNRKSLGALVALNVVLLMALVVVSLTPSRTQAQLGGAAGQYVMLAGEAVGQRNMNAIYITELTSARMVVVMFNGGNEKLDVIAGRDLKMDVKSGKPAGRGRGG